MAEGAAETVVGDGRPHREGSEWPTATQEKAHAEGGCLSYGRKLFARSRAWWPLKLGLPVPLPRRRKLALGFSVAAAILARPALLIVRRFAGLARSVRFAVAVAAVAFGRPGPRRPSCALISAIFAAPGPSMAV